MPCSRGWCYRRCLRCACRLVNRNTPRRTWCARHWSIRWRVSPPIRLPRDSTSCGRRWPPGSPADSACRRLIPATQVLPVSGTREALFAFAQAVIDPSRRSPVVVSPNPFYQIYEGAALLAGAEPAFLNQTARTAFAPDLESLTPDAVEPHAAGLRLLAGEPHGARAGSSMAGGRCSRTSRPPWLRHRIRRVLFGDLSGRSRAADWSALEAAARSGATRSEPGRLHEPVETIERSGAAVGRDGRRCGAAEAIPAVSHLSRVRDEPPRPAREHRGVAATNRTCATIERNTAPSSTPSCRCSTAVLDVHRPDAGFYLWAGVPGARRGVCARAVRATHVTVLPGHTSGVTRTAIIRERPRPHRPGARNRRLRRGRATRRGLLPSSLKDHMPTRSNPDRRGVRSRATSSHHVEPARRRPRSRHRRAERRRPPRRREKSTARG